VRHAKTIVLVAMLAFLIYGSSIVYTQQNAYPGYDNRYGPLIGGIQIEITQQFYWWPGYITSIDSLAFPVTFIEDGYRKKGFITAGHDVAPPLFGGDHVDQPTKACCWSWENYIGRAIRREFAPTGGQSDLDAALIRIERRDISPFIFENGIYYYIGGRPDANNRVGIINFTVPKKAWEKQLIVYKSGRTTGLTYGRIEQIDYAYRPYPNTVIYPTLLITRCPPNSQCFYNEPIANSGDSGGPVYIRFLISIEKIGSYYFYDYGATVIGIVSGRPPADNNFIYLVASWAVKVKERWNDIEWVTCGPNIAYCL
jgi:hypothetical protein